jgi:uncharacterized BrkB/YihY/UPF0761 family membrane protein
VRWGERRLERYSDTRIGSLLLGCLRRYAESSQNSASALVLNVFLSVVPALLAVYALADVSRGSDSGIARHLIDHLHLDGSTAALVSRTFGSASSNAAAASVIGLLTFFIFGLGIGKILQDVYARAWRVDVGVPTDQWRFAVFFVVSTALLGLQVSEESALSTLGWELLIPFWLVVLVAFWLWTPWFLLHRRIEPRRLLPGAALVAVGYTIAMTISQFLVGSWINENGHFFGSFGVALALLAWGQVLGAIWLGCAVFSPVYAEWRAGWKRDGAVER